MRRQAVLAATHRGGPTFHHRYVWRNRPRLEETPCWRPTRAGELGGVLALRVLGDQRPRQYQGRGTGSGLGARRWLRGNAHGPAWRGRLPRLRKVGADGRGEIGRVSSACCLGVVPSVGTDIIFIMERAAARRARRRRGRQRGLVPRPSGRAPASTRPPARHRRGATRGEAASCGGRAAVAGGGCPGGRPGALPTILDRGGFTGRTSART